MRDILLHLGRLDNSRQMAYPAVDDDGRLALAGTLARSFGARLSAIVTCQKQGIPVGALSWGMGPLMATASRSRQIEVDRLRQGFTGWASSHGIASHRFDAVEGDPADSLIERAESTDLIIMAGYDDGNRTARGMCGRVVIGAGVPVLLMPAVGARPQIGRTVLVAWNGSREGTRALRDALPFLRHADRVEIATVARHHRRPVLHTDDLISHAVRQGVRRVRHVTLAFEADSGVAGVLMERVREIGADLLVTGAFGRSWVSETIRGSTTSRLISYCPVPLLLSR